MEIENISFSVTRKLSLLITAIFGAFLLILGYTINTLLYVGDEIEMIQDVDIPLVEELSQLNTKELKRHVAGSRLYNARLDGFDEKQIQELAEEYHAISTLIGETLGAAEEDDGTLQSLITQKFEEDDASFIETLLSLNSASNKEAAVLSDPTTPIVKVEEAWHELDGILEEIGVSLQNTTKLVLKLSKADAKKLAKDEKNLIVRVIIASAIVLIVAFFVVRIVILNLTSPLAQITESSARISRGDLTSTALDIQSRDELAVLAGAFNKMQVRLRSQIVEMQSSVETLGASIQQTSASIEEQASSVKEEAATVQEITTTMQEIQQSGTEIAQRASEVTQSSEENLRVSEDGLEAVENTSKSMSLIREQVEEVAEKIVNLSEKTQAIGDIVSTVNEIAEQSNILAINASIEASDAGEKGSRFSIVAQEMKGLADQAKENTKQVRGILGDIQKGINTSVMLTEEAVKRAEAGKLHSESADTKIRNLLESTHGNMQAFRQIIAGTNQQQIGIDQITQGMQDIRQAGQQTVVGISELEQATGNLKAMSGQLKSIIEQYKV